MVGRFAWLLISAAVLPLNASAASFDCGRAHSQETRAICSNQKLSDLDDVMGGLYKDILKRTTPEMAENVRAEQRNWLKERHRCLGDPYCIALMYRGRIAELEDWKAKLPTNRSSNPDGSSNEPHQSSTTAAASDNRQSSDDSANPPGDKQQSTKPNPIPPFVAVNPTGHSVFRGLFLGEPLGQALKDTEISITKTDDKYTFGVENGNGAIAGFLFANDNFLVDKLILPPAFFSLDNSLMPDGFESKLEDHYKLTDPKTVSLSYTSMDVAFGASTVMSMLEVAEIMKDRASIPVYGLSYSSNNKETFTFVNLINSGFLIVTPTAEAKF